MIGGKIDVGLPIRRNDDLTDQERMMDVDMTPKEETIKKYQVR